jgi:sec-independent protein translocase protein TatA
LEIGLIVLLVLIVFGVGKLPQVGSALGRSIRLFRQAKAGEEDEESEDKTTVTKSTKVKVKDQKKNES